VWDDCFGFVVSTCGSVESFLQDLRLPARTLPLSIRRRYGSSTVHLGSCSLFSGFQIAIIFEGEKKRVERAQSELLHFAILSTLPKSLTKIRIVTKVHQKPLDVALRVDGRIGTQSTHTYK
jgi:hypothetical protein